VPVAGGEAARPDHAAWRVEVGRFRAAHPQRVFPLVVHLGRAAGPRVAVEVPWPVPVPYDDGLRFDLALALVERWLGQDEPESDGGAAYGWVGRVGDLHVHDEDVGWRFALHRAMGAYGRTPAGFRVVTKGGWLDPATGERKEWKRLRL
jgi:hypothetical protein